MSSNTEEESSQQTQEEINEQESTDQQSTEQDETEILEEPPQPLTSFAHLQGLTADFDEENEESEGSSRTPLETITEQTQLSTSQQLYTEVSSTTAMDDSQPGTSSSREYYSQSSKKDESTSSSSIDEDLWRWFCTGFQRADDKKPFGVKRKFESSIPSPSKLIPPPSNVVESNLGEQGSSSKLILPPTNIIESNLGEQENEEEPSKKKRKTSTIQKRGATQTHLFKPLGEENIAIEGNELQDNNIEVSATVAQDDVLPNTSTDEPARLPRRSCKSKSRRDIILHKKYCCSGDSNDSQSNYEDPCANSDSD